MPKIKVLDAVVNGCGAGAVLNVSDRAAAYLTKIGYAEVLAEPVKPAKPATRTAARKQQQPKERK